MNGGLGARPSISGLAARPWDLLVVGGGIVGAGVFHEATRAGLRCLLVEQADFASGTSSRTSKLIHGGLHYLRRFELGMTLALTRERNHLLRAEGATVQPLPFRVRTVRARGLPRTLLRSAGFAVYRALDGETPTPPGFDFQDGIADDARLVLREISKGAALGGTALNYCRMVEWVRDSETTRGARIQDLETGASSVIEARAVVSARGPWTPSIPGVPGHRRRPRLVRGSHLVVPRARLPLRHGVVSLRPETGEYVLFVPWRGVTLVGTTALECATLPTGEPRCTAEEVLLLLSDVSRSFPERGIGLDDIQATYAGVRSIVDLDTPDPSRASREEMIWEDHGVLSVTGGKLTGFRRTARQVLARLEGRLPQLRSLHAEDGATRTRPPTTLEDGGQTTGGTPQVAELRRIAASEGVRRLDDLLLRRTRLGLTLPGWGESCFPLVRAATDDLLGWDDTRWAGETRAYLERVRSYYGLPPDLAAQRTRSPRLVPVQWGGIAGPDVLEGIRQSLARG